MLDSKTQKKLEKEKGVTTFARDSPEDSMVQNDKDVDALMHLKITVVELYKRLLSRLDQNWQIGNILQDWIDDMLWGMTAMIWKERRQRRIGTEQKQQ